MGRLKFPTFSFLLVDFRVFSTGGMEGDPPPLAKSYSSIPLGKVSPENSPATKYLFPPPKVHFPQPTKFNFSIENFFF